MITKHDILTELKKAEFPNMKLLFSADALALASEILNELLEADTKDFEKLLEISANDICFDDFEDEGLLDYYWSLLNHFQGVNNTPVIRDIIDEFMPKLQDFGNYVAYNKTYFGLLQGCENSLEAKFERNDSVLLSDRKRAISERMKGFKERGIDLPKAKQTRLKELNKILSKRSQDFSNNIVDDQAIFSYEIKDFESIKNLPADVLASVKKDEKYIFSADPTAYGAIMKYCSDAKIRADFEKSRTSFASSGAFDNRPLVLDILKYKREKAVLLGFNNYAEVSLNDKMADSPEQVCTLIEGISEKAKVKANTEMQTLKDYFSLSTLVSSDIAYYSNIYKTEKYKFDDKILQKYFEYNSVLHYLHNFVKNFYGLELKEITAELYDNSVKIFEVYLEGELISYYLLDPFYRKEKRGGAWADNLRSKAPKYNKIPVVVNVCNFLHSTPTLLLMRDVETLFHEFGHAIHEMLSASSLSELSGFGLEWDAIELPSQLLENWVSDRGSLSKLAKHHETGEPISDEILDTLDTLDTYMSGAFVARQNEFALLDMYLYMDTPPANIEELDKKALDLINQHGVISRTADYKMYTSFGHIFGGGYAAGYYSYMWAEILEADVFARIKEMGMFDPEVGIFFRNTLLGQGCRKPASELFEDFMGRPVDNAAFMQRKGL